MDGYLRKNGDNCPQLLNLLKKQRREWVVKREEETNSDEKKLELSLGPPGGNYIAKNGDDNNSNILSFGYFSSPWQQQQKGSSILQIQSTRRDFQAKESSQPCCSKVVDLQQTAEKKKGISQATAANTAVTNSAQKRTAPAPVVGWPPIRSFRKNLASSNSLKSATESPNVVPNKADKKKSIENTQKGQFVKINMDGIPIGRKVDLTAYDTYEKLSAAVDELFRGLLAAQSDASAGRKEDKDKDEKVITGLLDGSGEYTLVYEDNEGDRMLVGDVPWHMFVSTVKRLRVLKTSELAMLCSGAKQGKHSHGYS